MRDERMNSNETQYKKLGPYAVRSNRDSWAESIEEKVRSKSPFPITYDVSAVQPPKFTEFSYTEFAGGFWVNTMSTEMNCRIMEFASQDNHPLNLDSFKKQLEDKYNLQEIPKKFKQIKKIVFLPGHNLLDVASNEILARLSHEEDDVYFKCHPITGDDVVKLIARTVGWDRILDKTLSGHQLLLQCDEVYTTSASEMAITATVLGKKVINVSNFFTEGAGTYHAVSRVLFRAHQKHSIEYAQQLLNNIIHCNYSGLLFNWQQNIDERIDTFYKKSLELRDIYKHLSCPRGHIGQAKKEEKNNNK